MLYAIVNGKRCTAVPRLKGTCPVCEAEVIPKCGQVITWHWAHKSRLDCDAWAEESEWHLEWKSQAAEDYCEVVIKRNEKVHRADIVVRGLVVELQASSISTREIRERESFYGNMVWLFKADQWSDRLEADSGASIFWWKHGHKSLLACQCPVYWDLDGYIVEVEVFEDEVEVEKYNPLSGQWYSDLATRVFVQFFSRAPRERLGSFLQKMTGKQ